jgi:ribulose bisphosphate carboxylase small subunit
MDVKDLAELKKQIEEFLSKGFIILVHHHGERPHSS